MNTDGEAQGIKREFGLWRLYCFPFDCQSMVINEKGHHSLIFALVLGAIMLSGFRRSERMLHGLSTTLD